MSSAAVELHRSSPESMGLPSSAIHTFVDQIEQKGLELHSLMILKKGSVIAEGWWHPFCKERVHLLYSLSKSFTSTAIGFAVQEGLLTIDDSVISFFPDQLPEKVSDHLKAMKVRHLLSMSTGHATENMIAELKDGDWVKGFLAREVVYEPGVHFLYNSTATYMLSAIITRLTGLTMLDYLGPRLLDPLGIKNSTWETCPHGMSVGGWGMSVTTEGIARFGQFYLQKGVWGGVRLLNEDWIDQATSYQVSNAQNESPDWREGYGFQFWRCRHNCYRGDGAFGQYCIVMPAHEIVVAITSSTSDLQGVLNLVWEHILGSAQADPLPEDNSAHESLVQKLSHLVIPGPTRTDDARLASNVTGKTFFTTDPSGRIHSVRYDFSETDCLLTIDTLSGLRTLKVGIDHWLPDTVTFETSTPQAVAAIGDWVEPDTFEIRVRYLESPSGFTIINRFTEGNVSFDSTVSGRFGPAEGPRFHGRIRHAATA